MSRLRGAIRAAFARRSALSHGQRRALHSAVRGAVGQSPGGTQESVRVETGPVAVQICVPIGADGGDVLDRCDLALVRWGPGSPPEGRGERMTQQGVRVGVRKGSGTSNASVLIDVCKSCFLRGL